MADFMASRRVAAAPRAASTLSVFARLSAALAVWKQRQNLADLDAHLRKDLGLSSNDIAAELRRPVWDVPHNWRF